MWRFLSVLFLMALVGAPAQACGVETNCKLGDRHFRIHLPERPAAKPMGAIIFAHGWRDSAAGTMQKASLLALADDLGVALVAADSTGDGWRLPGRPRETGNTGEEEFAYFRRLVDALEQRYAIDRDKLLMTGFSGGGMMVWNLACHRGALFAGFAPIAGTFWAPVPENCPSAPVDLIHYHGTADRMVPLMGREIADSKQGNVFQALSLLAESGGFGEVKSVDAERLDCKRRTNPQGRILEICTHPGGHSYEADYVRRAWRVLGIDAP